jgi:CheY-like chemotaxis protein
VVRKLVEMHGGEVRARSPGLGQGATFEIRLPRGKRASATEAESQSMRFIKRRVLVVDDNVDAADSLGQLLRLDGHTVETAYAARAAIDKFEAFHPDLVLLDIGLPEMDGYEVAHRLRQRGDARNVILVALTGYGQREDRERALVAGFDDHLVKPVNFPDLQRVIAG